MGNCQSDNVSNKQQQKMSAKILVVFYSTYGHCFLMAKAALEGVTKAGGTGTLKRVAETLPVEVLEKMHAVEAQKAFADVPIATAAELASYDGIVFVCPTRFGGIPAQMRALLDATGQLWMTGGLVGKVGGAITSSATQHGGQETTLQAFHIFLLHQGMLVSGLSYAFQGQMGLEAVKGCSPYGASTISGGDGSRLPSEVELEGARFQAQRITEVAAKLIAK